MTLEDHIEHSRSHPIIYYDAQCLLCDGFIHALIKRDLKSVFHYCSLQDNKALSVRDYQDMSDTISTVILLDNGEWYVQSDVSIRIAQIIGGPWGVIAVIRWIPEAFRHWVYRRIANNRYWLFGRSDECIVPDESIQSRFL